MEVRIDVQSLRELTVYIEREKRKDAINVYPNTDSRWGACTVKEIAVL